MSAGTANGESFACGAAVVAIGYSYLYAEGSIVYSVKKAKKGILEAIAIKSVKLSISKKTYGKVSTIYVDTFNSYWNESDLCLEEDARAYAIEYLEALQLQLQEELEC